MHDDHREFQVRLRWAILAGLTALVWKIWHSGSEWMSLWDHLAPHGEFAFGFQLLADLIPGPVVALVAGFCLAPGASSGKSRFRPWAAGSPPVGLASPPVRLQVGLAPSWVVLGAFYGSAAALHGFGYRFSGWFWLSGLLLGLATDGYRIWELPGGQKMATFFGLQLPLQRSGPRLTTAPVGPTRDDSAVYRARVSRATMAGVLAYVGAWLLSCTWIWGLLSPEARSNTLVQLTYALLPVGYLAYRLAYALQPLGVPSNPLNLPTVLDLQNPLVELPEVGGIPWKQRLGCLVLSFAFPPLWGLMLMLLLLPMFPVFMLLANVKVPSAGIFLLPWLLLLPVLLLRSRRRRWLELDCSSLRLIPHLRRGGYEFTSSEYAHARLLGFGVRTRGPFHTPVAFLSDASIVELGQASPSLEQAATLAFRLGATLLLPVLDPEIGTNAVELENWARSGQIKQKLLLWPPVTAATDVSDNPPIS